MSRKLLFLSCLVLMLSLVGNVLAADVEWDNDNGAGDRLWDTPANWDTDTVPNLADDDIAIMDSIYTDVNNGPIIQDGINAECGWLEMGYKRPPVEQVVLTMTGGTLTAGSWIDIGGYNAGYYAFDMSGGQLNVIGQGQGTWEGIWLAFSSNAYAVMNMSGGDVDVFGGLWIGWQPGSSATFNMTGGTYNGHYVYVGSWSTDNGAGLMNLQGGSLHCKDFSMGPVSHMNIAGGVLTCETDLTVANGWLFDPENDTRVESPDGIRGDAPGYTATLPMLVEMGRVTAYNTNSGDIITEDANYPAKVGLRALVKIDYDHTNPGMTTVWAEAVNPNLAYNPTPTDGSVNVDPDITLTWTPGIDAASHDVYFGTNYDEVNDANLSDLSGIYRGTQDCDVNSYIPPENPLELGKTYYWRIDEVNGLDLWKGDIWSFTTGQPAQQYLVIDDMESYESSIDIDDTWVEAGRAIITLQTAADPNYVHGEDGNSMKYGFYNNFSPYYSETRASIADLQIGPDWTVNGSQILTLYFRADFDNTVDDVQPMSVFVFDGVSTAAVEYDDPNDLIRGEDGWKQWNIELQELADAGVDLTNITEMGITIGDGLAAAGVGYVYFDDIRLYPDTPQEPMCWQEQTKLLASDGAAYDSFGYQVSICDDYAIVGARGDDDNGYSSGSAYIFVRDGENWLQQAKLLPSDGQGGDLFGYSVSIGGNYCIIGAHMDDDYGYSSGSAYIFVRDGNNWTQQAKLLASDSQEHDSFGCSVSISGDYCIIGAYQNDGNDYNSGSAYIFVRDGENWLQQTKLTASDGHEADFFGHSVSISGNYCVIGAYQDDDNGYNSGSAYIFVRDGNNWTRQAKLTASDGQEHDYFGYSVSINGDYCLVGAYEDDDNGYASGSAYMFKREAELWSEQEKLTASDGAAGDWFGISVSVSGDYAIVGDSNDGDNGYWSGSAYTFVRDGDNWLQQTKLLPSDGQERDLFGVSVSMSGDYCIVGALFDDDNGSDSGSAYVFSGTACGPENAPPIADAGPDQTVYTTGDEADVTLDGSASYDPDDDELTYTWFSNDPNDPNGQVVIATGVSPTVSLPMGQHTIDLIVNDGQDDSEPDQVVITVVSSPDIEADLKLAPKPFSCDKPFGGPNKNAWFILNLVLPEGFLPEDVDTSAPAIFTPGEVESAYIETSINDDGRVVVETVFEHDEICDALPPAPGGLLDITVTGSLTDGRHFYGTATMKVMQ